MPNQFHSARCYFLAFRVGHKSLFRTALYWQFVRADLNPSRKAGIQLA